MGKRDDLLMKISLEMDIPIEIVRKVALDVMYSEYPPNNPEDLKRAIKMELENI